MSSTLLKLKENRGLTLPIEFSDGTITSLFIEEIDENFDTVKFLNKNGILKLEEIKKLKGGNLLSNEIAAIVNNPENFSVFPIHEIKDVIKIA